MFWVLMKFKITNKSTFQVYTKLELRRKGRGMSIIPVT